MFVIIIYIKKKTLLIYCLCCVVSEMDVKLSTIEREVLAAPKSPLHESPFKRKGRK